MYDRRKERLTRQRKKRERQLRLLKSAGCTLLLLLIFLAIYGLSNRISRKNKPTVNQSTEQQGDPEILTNISANKESYITQLESLQTEYPNIKKILEKQSQYPPELLQLLASNIETLDFVSNYLNKKDTHNEDILIQDVVQGEIPLLLQWDERWGYELYGDKMISLTGCGPTCISMVATGLTGRDDITPLEVANYSAQNGYLAADNSTDWRLMTEGCLNYGITGVMLGLDENAMINTLNSGMPIICSMTPGDFTTTGHFIILTSYQDGKFTVNDPNSKARSNQLWSYDDISDQIANLWYFYLT